MHTLVYSQKTSTVLLKAAAKRRLPSQKFDKSLVLAEFFGGLQKDNYVSLNVSKYFQNLLSTISSYHNYTKSLGMTKKGYHKNYDPRYTNFVSHSLQTFN